MRLKKLEIYGFKSFCQRTEILFNQGITGIVGPNGSGKSNIGDAVRWVLGEQSAKLLRGAKMEDVIFNGTEKRKPMSYCEVSLAFDNADHALPMDYAEVMVTRRVYRSGESEYYLNKAGCRLKDVIELFRDTGIGKEGYSIIGQGRIDEILSQKSEDRRQVFEEAAGIVKFKTRKEEAQKKLERTQENLSRVEDILEELHNRLEPLRGQAETARAYLELSQELKGLEMNIFLIRHDKMKERIQELEKTLEGLEAALSQGAALLGEKTLAREELDGRLQRLEEEISAAREELTAAADRCHQENAAGQKLDQRLENHRENRGRLDSEEEKERERLSGLQELLGRSGDGQEKQDAALKDAKAALEKEKEALAAAAGEARDQEAALEEHKAAILEAMNRLSSVQNAQARQQAVQAQMENRLKELNAQGEELEARRKELEAMYQSAGETGASVAQGLAALKEEAFRLDGRVQALAGEMNQRAEKVKEASARQQALNSRLRVLEEMARDFEGYNQSVRRALTYAKAQGLERVRGVVAMLIRVPKNLETAIDMVLGAALQNIVTQDEHAAKDMIQYLRQNKLGRATFLPMSAIRGRVLSQEERKVLSMPGCLGVASELISFEAEYRGVMENLLGRTVIAENIDCGIQIMRAGRQAFRLVTLDGDVMHSGGSMTGGSVQTKMTNLLGREREIKELKAELGRIQKELAREAGELEELERERAQQKRLRNEAAQRVHQEEIAAAREQERVSSAKAELNAHLNRMAQVSQARQQLTDSLSQIARDLDRISRETGGVELDKEAMQEKSAELQQRVNLARERVHKLQETVTAHMVETAGYQHQLESLIRDRQRLNGEMDLSRRRLEEIGRERKEAEAALKRDAQDRERSRKAEAALREEAARKEEQVRAREERRAALQARQRELHREMEDLHQQTAQDSDKQHRTELQKARVEGDLSAMQERIWNTYEMTYAGAEAFREGDKFDLGAGEKRAAELKGRIKAMGPVNVQAIEEFAQTQERFNELNAQRQDLHHAEEDLNALIERLITQMEKQFVSQFELMKGYFSETFVRLFGGGHAELRLSDPGDALNCGVEVIAQPPGKKLQLLSLLSGGERALTAIAILFAMLKLKPTPFCILDEIDAPLDEANVGYFADYLVEYGENTQFVVVTHRKGTMERADALYGVAMEEQGVSKMVSVNLTDYQA